MSARIDELIYACQEAGSIAPLLRAALPDESDAEIQRGADALHLAGRKKAPLTAECNERRADFVACYRSRREGRGFDASAFEYALSRFRQLPDGSVITETRARALVGSKCPTVVAEILRRRNCPT